MGRRRNKIITEGLKYPCILVECGHDNNYYLITSEESAMRASIRVIRNMIQDGIFLHPGELTDLKKLPPEDECERLPEPYRTMALSDHSYNRAIEDRHQRMVRDYETAVRAVETNDSALAFLLVCKHGDGFVQFSDLITDHDV